MVFKSLWWSRLPTTTYHHEAMIRNDHWRSLRKGATSWPSGQSFVCRCWLKFILQVIGPLIHYWTSPDMLTWKGRYSGARLNGQTRRPSSSSSPFLFKTRLSYRFLLADSSDSAKKCLEMCAISRSNAVARSTSTQPFMLVLGMRFLSATLSITLKEHKTFSVCSPNFAQVRND